MQERSLKDVLADGVVLAQSDAEILAASAAHGAIPQADTDRPYQPWGTISERGFWLITPNTGYAGFPSATAFAGKPLPPPVDDSKVLPGETVEWTGNAFVLRNRAAEEALRPRGDVLEALAEMKAQLDRTAKQLDAMEAKLDEALRPISFEPSGFTHAIRSEP